MLIFFFVLQGYAENQFLKTTYYVESSDINITTLVSHAKNDALLFTIPSDRESLKVKSKELLERLKEHGYGDYTSHANYIKFIKKSPIDLLPLTLEIQSYYKKMYENIDILDISIMPRGYIEKLPEHYDVYFQSRSYLSNSSTLYLKTADKKKIFFDYTIEAILPVVKSTKPIKRSEAITMMNAKSEFVKLDKFRYAPLQSISAQIQSKHQLRAQRIILLSDIETLKVVRRGSIINISHANEAIFITFSARALQDGKLNDIIEVQKSDGTRLRVKVTGKNQAELQ